MTYQNLIIVGRLGRDPELHYTPNGQAVCSMNIATDRQYENKDGLKVKQTTWFRVSVWGKQAESCNQYLHKGSQCLVQGRLNPDESGGPKVFTRADGSTGASYEIVAENVRFLGGGAGDTGVGAQSQSEPQGFSEDDFGDF